MFAVNPFEAIRPDFTSAEHQEACQHLIDEGLNNDQAARSLASLWTLTNNSDRERWTARQEHLEEVRLREEEEDDQRQQALREDEEAARLEDRKKHKNKYAPIRRGKVPSDPTILPAQYTTRKMKAGEYCELHYFTNRGLDDAKETNLIAEPDALMMLPASDGLHSWVPAASIRDPKASPVTKDEHLSWEEFNEAAPRMINSMKTHDWPDDRVDMHIQFWSALQTHRWRHAPDHLKQRALLLYQSQQRCRWHLAVGTTQGWSLEELNQELLLEAREELFNEQRVQQTAAAIKQAATDYIAHNRDSLRPQPSTAAHVPTSQKRSFPSSEDASESHKKR